MAISINLNRESPISFSSCQNDNGNQTHENDFFQKRQSIKSDRNPTFLASACALFFDFHSSPSIWIMISVK
jgi:hypothetical protein